MTPTDIFIEKATKIHGDRYFYDLVDYKKSDVKVSIVCRQHGIFEQVPNSHLSRRGCPSCANKNVSTEIFVAKARACHGSKYDYSNVVYRNNRDKIDIICGKHGLFQQSPSDHLGGRGCYHCGVERNTARCRKSFIDFVKEANIIHSGKYTYDETTYTTALEKTAIRCPDHGVFLQKPNGHLTGKQGCPKCAGTGVYSFDDFLKEARTVHGDFYAYDEASFSKLTAKTKITCPDHGVFWQMAVNHIKKTTRCPKCRKHISKVETDYLDSLELPDDPEHRQVYVPVDGMRTGFRVDGFDPSTNTVYEFHGDFWHGNPERYAANDVNPMTKKTFGEHYRETLTKKRLLEDAGYRVVEMWESEWRKQIKTA